VTKGLKYGSQFLKFSKNWEDEAQKRKSSPKGIHVIGKFDEKCINATRENIIPGDVKYINGVTSRETKLIQSLCSAMIENGQVLIVSFKSTAAAGRG